MNDQDSYAAVLADLERERDGLTAAINLIRRKIGMEVGEAPAAPSNGQPGGSDASVTADITPDAFFGMKLPDAIKNYLSRVRRPTKVSVIIKALIGGGFQSTSKNFPAAVQTALTRIRGEVVNLPNGWALAEWYPGRTFEKKTRDKKKSEGKKGSA